MSVFLRRGGAVPELCVCELSHEIKIGEGAFFWLNSQRPRFFCLVSRVESTHFQDRTRQITTIQGTAHSEPYPHLGMEEYGQPIML